MDRMSPLRRAPAWVWAHRPRLHSLANPTDLPSTIDVVKTHGRRIRSLVMANFMWVCVAPILTLLVINIGQAGRDQNCDVVEHTFLGFSHDITEALVTATPAPATPEAKAAQDIAAEAFQKDLQSRIEQRMDGCRG